MKTIAWLKTACKRWLLFLPSGAHESTLSSEELFLEQADDSDKFPRTLYAIVVKASSEHKKGTCKWTWLIGWFVITH